MRYIPGKDCSEYCEDYIATHGGRLLSLMFFNTELATPRKSFYHPLRMDDTNVREEYEYHTVVLVDSVTLTVLDVTNGGTLLTLPQLIRNICTANWSVTKTMKMEAYAVLDIVPEHIRYQSEIRARVPQEQFMWYNCLRTFEFTNEF